ncbi:hypothetical protein K438DRAFT_2001909 [Mycena galopus ATCC 62051]|nr:hypothetical protein K438DRAFT_2001909 [Mycena galopus ATCC 62051]
MTDSPEMRWLKSQILALPVGELVPEQGTPHFNARRRTLQPRRAPRLTRFGEQADSVLSVLAGKNPACDHHAIKKAAQKQQQQVPPATKPAKKKAREENATGKGKGRNDVRSAAARAPATVIRTPPSAISSSATSTPASVMVHSTPISATETCELQVAVYTDHDQPPLEFRVSVRGLDHFDFTSLNAVKVVGAVPEMGQPAGITCGTPPLMTSGYASGPLNGRVPEDACPGLLGFVVDVLKSILDEAGGVYNNTTGDADTSDWGDGASSDFGFDVSVPSLPSPSSGNASSPLKRRWTSEYAEEAVVIEEEEKNVSKLKRPRLVGSMVEPIVLD